MSTSNPKNFLEWYQNLPLPFLVGGPNGRAEATALGTVMDLEAQRLRDAAKVAFPSYTPSDGVPHVGNDRALIQGPAESEANFRIRLKYSWEDWARAGTWLELLVQLYWTGFSGAVIVQQNGLGYSLSGSPTAGVDPTGLLTITTLGTNPKYNEPWWAFDNRDDLCDRFAVLFPTGAPSFSASDLARMRSIIDRWKPAREECQFISVFVSGNVWGWPVRTWNNGELYNSGTVTIYPGV